MCNLGFPNPCFLASSSLRKYSMCWVRRVQTQTGNISCSCRSTAGHELFTEAAELFFFGDRSTTWLCLHFCRSTPQPRFFACDEHDSLSCLITAASIHDNDLRGPGRASCLTSG